MTAPLDPRQVVLLVARREFVSQVKSRGFVIGIVITIVLFGGLFLLSAYISSESDSKTLGVTQQTAALGPELEQSAKTQGIDLTVRTVDDGAGRQQVDSGDLDALFTGESGGYELLGLDSVDSRLQTLVSSAVQQQTLTSALTGAGIDPAQLTAQAKVSVDTLEPVDPESGQKLALALVGVILLFFTLSGNGQVVATGVVEEKQSRVVELLLATIKPWQLMAGKIIGLGAVGLLQLVILSAISAVSASAAGLLTVPTAAVGMFIMVVVWYLLGFFLFAALYAAIGSTVSRQEELNSVVAPMIFLLLIPFVLTLNLLPNDPRNGVAGGAVVHPVLLPDRDARPLRPRRGTAVAGAGVRADRDGRDRRGGAPGRAGLPELRAAHRRQGEPA